MIQKLAVLWALSLWRRGAVGPLSLHKTLFLADESAKPKWRLFTFKKWRLGEFSDEISEALNKLRSAGRISTCFDGPSERIRAELSRREAAALRRFFGRFFPNWNRELRRAFRRWANLTSDDILEMAASNATHNSSRRGDVVFASLAPDRIELDGLDDDEAEWLSDLVDERLHRELSKRIERAAKRPAHGEDWRSIYFGRGQKKEAGA
ncbi:MAG: hypothetical protein HYS13_22465 [Planctomycetia bacterium]|nr:hypothetical protein [Planctomycetia bacterium]